MTKIPRHITEQYPDGAHGFRAEKRAAVRELLSQLDDMRHGCAYLPNGSAPIDRLTKELQDLKASLSVKAWGR